MTFHPLTLGVLIGTLLTRLSTFFVMPFFAIYLTRLDFSAGVTGSVFAVTALSSLAMSFIGGTLSDRYGRKRLLFTGVFLNVVTFVGLAFASTIVHFYGLAVLLGVSRSLLEPVSRALLADVTKEEERVKVYNLRYFLINIAAAIGPLLAVWLGLGGERQAFYLVSVMYALYGFGMFGLFARYPLQETSPKKEVVRLNETFRVLAHDRVFALVVLGMVFAIIGFSQLNSTLPQYLERSGLFVDGASVYATLLTVNAVSVLVFQYPLMKFGLKVSPLRSLSFGVTALSVGLFCMGWADTLVGLMLAMIVLTIGEVLMFTMTDTLTDELAPDYLRGTYFGAMGLTGIGNTIGPLLGGGLLSWWSPDASRSIFGILAMITFLGLIFFVMAQKRRAQVAVERSLTG